MSSHPESAPKVVLPMSSQPLPGVDSTIAQIIRSRRTIGAFRTQHPARETVLQAIELARWAPNHKKTEPWRVIWAGPQTIKSIIDINSRILTASKGAAEADSKARKWAQIPGWLVITCELASDPFRREEDYAACCCAIQNLQLALWSAGIGTKWSTGDVTRHPDFLSLLGIDTSCQRTVGMVWYGYPEIVPDQSRRPVEQYLREMP